MPAVRRVLKHVSAEIAKGQRDCSRNDDHFIRPGEKFLLVKKADQGYDNYCMKCAKEILEVAENHIRETRSTLGV